MPRPSRLRLPPLDLGDETFGQRLARIRKEHGVTQVELAKKTGLLQALISAYERDRLRLRADIAVRFAIALSVSADDLLGLKPAKEILNRRTARLLKRLRRIEELPPTDQRVVLRTLDALLARGGNGNGHRRSPRR